MGIDTRKSFKKNPTMDKLFHGVLKTVRGLTPLNQEAKKNTNPTPEQMKKARRY